MAKQDTDISLTIGVLGDAEKAIDRFLGKLDRLDQANAKITLGTERGTAAATRAAKSSVDLGKATETNDQWFRRFGATVTDVNDRLRTAEQRAAMLANAGKTIQASFGGGLATGTDSLLKALNATEERAKGVTTAINNSVRAVTQQAAQVPPIIERAEAQIRRSYQRTEEAMNRSRGMGSMQRRSLIYTASDIISSSANGMSPGTIALQQGPQLLQAFAVSSRIGLGAMAGYGAVIAAAAVPLILALKELGAAIRMRGNALDTITGANEKTGLTLEKMIAQKRSDGSITPEQADDFMNRNRAIGTQSNIAKANTGLGSAWELYRQGEVGAAGSALLRDPDMAMMIGGPLFGPAMREQALAAQEQAAKSAMDAYNKLLAEVRAADKASNATREAESIQNEQNRLLIQSQLNEAEVRENEAKLTLILGDEGASFNARLEAIRSFHAKEAEAIEYQGMLELNVIEKRIEAKKSEISRTQNNKDKEVQLLTELSALEAQRDAGKLAREAQIKESTEQRLAREREETVRSISGDWRITEAEKYRRLGAVPTDNGVAGTSLQRQNGPNPDSLGQQMQANLVQLQNSWGTTAMQIADTITNTIGTAISSIGDNITGVIMKTQSWGQALANIGTTILSSVINAIIKMGVQYVLTSVIMAVAGKAIQASMVAASAPIAVAQAAIWAVPATLATIASYGGAAAAAPGFIAAAEGVVLASSLAAFADGGYTGSGGKYEAAGVVHRREFVIPSETVDRLGPEYFQTRYMPGGGAASASVRAPSAGFAQGGYTGDGGGSSTSIGVGVFADASLMEKWMENGNFDRRVRKTLNDIGIRA